jgi:hypothetical protein
MLLKQQQQAQQQQQDPLFKCNNKSYNLKQQEVQIKHKKQSRY